MGVRCFFVEPTDRCRRYLRRFASASCTGPMSYHDADCLIDEVERKYDEKNDCWPMAPPINVSHEDVRWPKECQCGYKFKPDDKWQDFSRQLYIDKQTSTLYTLRDKMPGMMWYADWMGIKGPDGHCLVVVCPGGGEWMVDSRCSNCTLPDDNVHRCWVRHGTPPNVTVDKQGVSCSAGGGSIISRSYHGFLRNGEFT